MKKWKNRLLPIFTCLVVLGAALLPQRLSELRDHTLMGTVHTEKLTDNWLLARPLSLAERIELLTLWSDEPERFTVVTQELSVKMAPEEILALQTQVWKELKSLADAGIFPDEMLQEETSDLSGERTSVRLSDDLRSTTFCGWIDLTNGAGCIYPSLWMQILDMQLPCRRFAQHLYGHPRPPRTLVKPFWIA